MSKIEKTLDVYFFHKTKATGKIEVTSILSNKEGVGDTLEEAIQDHINNFNGTDRGWATEEVLTNLYKPDQIVIKKFALTLKD